MPVNISALLKIDRTQLLEMHCILQVINSELFCLNLMILTIIAAVLVSGVGVLRIVSGTTLFGNRTIQTNGDSVTLTYTAGRVGDDTKAYSMPSVVWLKDGASARTTPSNMAVGSNGQLSSTLTFTFQEADAGIYQFVFIGRDSEVYGTFPLRLDTGNLAPNFRLIQ